LYVIAENDTLRVWGDATISIAKELYGNVFDYGEFYLNNIKLFEFNNLSQISFISTEYEDGIYEVKMIIFRFW